MAKRLRAASARPCGRRAAHAILLAAGAAALAALAVGGCTRYHTLAQNEIGAYGWDSRPSTVENPQRRRLPIVDNENYWIQKEVQPEEAFPGPTPADLRTPEGDYILGPGDLVDIIIQELLRPGEPYGVQQRISQSGQISLPYVGTIKAAGLTARGLEEKIADILEPDYLIGPQVSIFVREFRNLSVALLAGVFRPGLYEMPKQDMTLLELIAQAGGVVQLVEDYGYIIREYAPEEADLLMLEQGLPGIEETPEMPALPALEVPPAPEREETDETESEPPAPAAIGIMPGGEDVEEAMNETAPEGAPGERTAPPADAREMLERMAVGEMPEVREIERAETALAAATPAPDATRAAAPADGEELGRWIWMDGKWVEVKPAAPPATPEPPPAETPPAEIPAEEAPPSEEAPTETAVVEVPPPTRETPAEVPVEDGAFAKARRSLEEKLRRLGVVQGSGQLRRIIRFDVEALQAGDPTQNIVLRDGDIVTIPSPPVGDFYMVGQVSRPGVYSLTGRKITVLQAVAAAGGLTAVAVPWRTELVRRVAEDTEEIVYVDLAKIARGEAPDFYLHPEDVVRVGTDQGAIFNAVLRNAFRATYGLGAVYDMNFADFYPWTDAAYPLFPGFH